MSDDNTQGGAEPSPASAGSQPVAWEIRRSDGALEAITRCVGMSEQILRCIGGGTILPLHRQPQPTLTDEERDVLDRLAHDASYRRMERTERVLRGLLERLGRERQRSQAANEGGGQHERH